MTAALVLGFVVVALGAAVLHRRGRRTAGVVLLAAAAVAVVAVSVTVGREGVGQLVLGGLVGCPVLVAVGASTDRRERARTSAGVAR